jgi:hypothetical protein
LYDTIRTSTKRKQEEQQYFSAMMNQGVQMQSSPMAAAPPPHHPDGPDTAVSRSLSPRPLDGDFDEEIYTNVLEPPPPPPPPRRNSNGGNGSSRSERKTMEQQQYQQPPPSSRVSESYQQREPLNSLTPDPEHQQQYAFEQHDAPKEHSGCDPNMQYSESSNVVTKKKKPKSSSHSRPPVQPGSKSAEYGSRIESFHKIMLENIEKETMMIRSQGSFQLHQKNLSNKSRNRSSGNNSHGENSENRNGGTQQRRRSSSFRVDASGVVITAENANVGSLFKETMKDISVAAVHTMESLKSAIQHTKDRAASNGMVTGPMVCGGVNNSVTAFGQEEGNDSLDGILDPAKKSSYPLPRSSSAGRTPQSSRIANVERLPLLRTSSGTELMKKMHQMSDAFRKVVVDATATGGDHNNRGSGDNDQRRDEKDEEEDSTSADAWGLGKVLANGFGWEGDGGGEYEEDDDDRSRASYDTWDEENSVLRRLGSWGTVNSQFTAGTLGTMATYDTEAGPSIIGPVSAAIAAASAAKADAIVPRNGDQLVVPGSHHLRNNSEALHDDNGSLIDPALVEAALKKKQQKEKDPKKKKKKRRGGRKKVVKFDYPPISSLRQYTRPDPEDLPNLFFTEHELDQIEDDRYSTMSTDDIEIVAVSSKENPSADDGDDAMDAKARASKKKPVSFAASSSDKDASAEHEPGFRPVKGRSGTPDRRRSSKKSPSKNNNTSANNNSGEEPNGPSSPRRLVKGVQIYLRERSTGT